MELAQTVHFLCELGGLAIGTMFKEQKIDSLFGNFLLKLLLV